jgi:DNA-binding transcriptional LysR family regulator
MLAMKVAGAIETAVPGIQVEVVSAPTPRDKMRRLIDGEADASFMWVPPGGTPLNDAPVRQDRRAVAVAEAHELAGRSVVTLRDLADAPVVITDRFFCESEVRYWIADPRPDGRPAVRGPVVSQVEEALMQVKRGNGVWLAPEPLARWADPVPGVRWVAVDDAEDFPLSAVWSDDAPTDLVALLVAEARTACSPN